MPGHDSSDRDRSISRHSTGDRPRRRESSATYTRRRLLVAGAVAGAPLALWGFGRSSGNAKGDSVGSPPPTQPVTSTSSVPTSLSATTVPTTSGAITRDLTLGMVNDDVARLQERLLELRFDPGPVDGFFGEATLRSVWAFGKLVLETPREEAAGVVTPAMWDTLSAPVTIGPRRSSNAQANHTEIYLPEQVLAVFHRDIPVLVTHMASGELDENGEPAEWCELVTVDIDERGNPLEEPIERDICGRSKTPGGVFGFSRRVEGIRNGALGSMWNPVYFNYGIAVHGAIDVPAEPASHGCVRIPMHIADYFGDLAANGDRVLVWNGEQPPEQVSEQDMLPVFDYANPNATSTTTSTTTPPTTTAPSTTSTSSSTTTSTTAPLDSAVVSGTIAER